ncbi:MAG TPA: alpha-L-fucosidase [Capsulimonadaceae bacterium]|jgi:alpha-L-fucosidase
MNLALPTQKQIEWQEMEVGMFIHYDIPVFAPGYDFRANPAVGVPSAELFNPTQLDTDQWIAAAVSIGAKYAVLTAKHCTGFCLWPTTAYPYSVKESPWKDGGGDVVADFVASCRKYGIRPALYCSFPANWYLRVDDPGVVLSGDPDEQRRYVKIYETITEELWSKYGELVEIWFDGSAPPVSEGGPDLMPLLNRYQPDAVCFQGPKPSVRWVGNEDGWARYPCWSTVSDKGRYGPDGDSGYAGNPDEAYWCGSEVDVTLIHREYNGGWMWSPGCEDHIYSLDHLIGVYYSSVGRNCNLLLNASPGPDGLIPDSHMRRYEEFGAEIERRFGRPLASTAGVGSEITLALPKSHTVVDHVILQEDISGGHRIREYVVESNAEYGWREIARGSAVGHKRIEYFPPIEATNLRVRVTQCVGTPIVSAFAAYDTGSGRSRGTASTA